MATRNANSEEFDVNNQMGMEQSESSAIESATSSKENIESRAWGQESVPPEINLNMLMTLIRQQGEEQRKHIDETRKQKEEMRKHIDEKIEETIKIKLLVYKSIKISNKICGRHVTKV